MGSTAACVLCVTKPKNRGMLRTYFNRVADLDLPMTNSNVAKTNSLLRQTLRFLSTGLGVELEYLEGELSPPLEFSLCKECEGLWAEAQRLMSAYQELTGKIKTLVQTSISLALDKGQVENPLLFGGNEDNNEKCRKFRQAVCGTDAKLPDDDDDELEMEMEIKSEVKEEVLEWEIDPLEDGDGDVIKVESTAGDFGPGVDVEMVSDPDDRNNFLPETETPEVMGMGMGMNVEEIENIEIQPTINVKIEDELELEEDFLHVDNDEDDDGEGATELVTDSESATRPTQTSTSKSTSQPKSKILLSGPPRPVPGPSGTSQLLTFTFTPTFTPTFTFTPTPTKLICYADKISYLLGDSKSSRTEWKPIQCPICDTDLHTSAQHNQHLEAHQVNSPLEDIKFLRCRFFLTCGEKKRSRWGANWMRVHEMQEHADQLPFECPEATCRKRYFQSELLLAHSVVHENKYTNNSKRKFKYNCSICHLACAGSGQTPEEKFDTRAWFTTKEELEEHLILQHNWEKRTQVNSCDMCNRVFNDKKSLKKHLLTHRTDIERHDCEVCQKKFKQYESLIKHLLQVHENENIENPSDNQTDNQNQNWFHCEKPNCDKKFRLKTLFQWHENVHKRYDEKRDQYEFNCDICSIPYSTKEALEGHVKYWHTALSNKYRYRYTCPLGLDGCKIKFSASTKSTVMRHIRECHPKLLKFKCEPCGKQYYTEDFLKTHLTTHPDWEPDTDTEDSNYDGPLIFRCEVCHKQFLDREILSEHLSKHNGEDHSKCPHCSKSFKSSQILWYHMRSDHGVGLPYKCDVIGVDKQMCRFSFPCKKDLLHHKKNRHPGPDAVRSFVCEFCSKGFYTEPVLKLHVKKVHIQKPTETVCEICGKTYMYIKEHMRTVHSGKERRFKCYFCHQVFPTLFCLRCHLYTHTKERPFICNLCGRDFNQQHCLKKHICPATANATSKTTRGQNAAAAKDKNRNFKTTKARTRTRKLSKLTPSSFGASSGSVGSTLENFPTTSTTQTLDPLDPYQSHYLFPQAQSLPQQFVDFQQTQFPPNSVTLAAAAAGSHSRITRSASASATTSTNTSGSFFAGGGGSSTTYANQQNPAQFQDQHPFNLHSQPGVDYNFNS